MVIISNIDNFFTAFIFNLPHNIFFDSFFSLLSAVGNGSIIWWILGLIVLFIFEESHHKKFLLIFIISILVSSLVSNNLLKPFFMRQRPIISLKKTIQISPITVEQQYPLDYSFPSSHATIAFAAAVILSYFDKKRRTAFYVIAILISFSRVYLGYHFFFDVIIGALIGYTISKIILYSYETQRSRITRST